MLLVVEIKSLKPILLDLFKIKKEYAINLWEEEVFRLFTDLMYTLLLQRWLEGLKISPDYGDFTDSSL